MAEKVTVNNGRFVAGQTRPKNAGRKKGTPNRKTIELVEILGSFNPLEKLKEIFEKTSDENLQARICLELLKYIYPQRKAVEVAMNEDSTPTININGIKI